MTTCDLTYKGFSISTDRNGIFIADNGNDDVPRFQSATYNGVKAQIDVYLKQTGGRKKIAVPVVVMDDHYEVRKATFVGVSGINGDIKVTPNSSNSWIKILAMWPVNHRDVETLTRLYDERSKLLERLTTIDGEMNAMCEAAPIWKNRFTRFSQEVDVAIKREREMEAVLTAFAARAVK